MKVFAIFMFALALSACNTVSGAGKDISHSSDWVKSKMSGGSKEAPQKTSPATKPEPVAPAQPAAPTSI